VLRGTGPLPHTLKDSPSFSACFGVSGGKRVGDVSAGKCRRTNSKVARDFLSNDPYRRGMSQRLTEATVLCQLFPGPLGWCCHWPWKIEGHKYASNGASKTDGPISECGKGCWPIVPFGRRAEWDRKAPFCKNEPENLLKTMDRRLKTGSNEPKNKAEKLIRVNTR
jgi:hypothetical protein